MAPPPLWVLPAPPPHAGNSCPDLSLHKKIFGLVVLRLTPKPKPSSDGALVAICKRKRRGETPTWGGGQRPQSLFTWETAPSRTRRLFRLLTGALTLDVNRKIVALSAPKISEAVSRRGNAKFRPIPHQWLTTKGEGQNSKRQPSRTTGGATFPSPQDPLFCWMEPPFHTSNPPTGAGAANLTKPDIEDFREQYARARPRG